MRRHAQSRLLVPSALLASVAASASWGQATFTGLGIPDGFRSASAWGISADGSAVTGALEHDDGHFEAFRWTEQGGVAALGVLNGMSWGSAISGDGSVVAGRGAGPDGFATAMRWTQSQGLQDLGIPDGYDWAEANTISRDGGVLAGMHWNVFENRSEALRWTEAGGFESIGELSGGSHHATAHGISADGGTVVGGSSSHIGVEAFRWTSGAGMVGLGVLPGGESSNALAVSGDGGVIVGASNVSDEDVAFRWTEAGGMAALGVLPGFDRSRANATNEDGSVVVGFANADTLGSTPFIWTQGQGIRDLQSVLESDHGLDLSGWTLEWATGVSSDGLTITGRGRGPLGNRQSWIATLPAPSTAILTIAGLPCISRRR